MTSLASPAEVQNSKSDSSSLSRTIDAIRSKLSSAVNSALEVKPRGFFADQFENESNFKAHYHGTGPEILRQTNGRIDAFVSGAGKCNSALWSWKSISMDYTGTGGTISGTGHYLKEHLPDVKIILSDPEGSGLYNKVRFNVMFDPKESEGKKRRYVMRAWAVTCSSGSDTRSILWWRVSGFIG